MSTDFGFHCKGCDVYSFFEWHNQGGADAARRLFSAMPKLKVIYDNLKSLEGAGYPFNLLALEANNNSWLIESIEFLSLHFGHDIVLEDEYGEEEPPLGDYKASIEPIGKLCFDSDRQTFYISLTEEKIKRLKAKRIFELLIDN